ncbi:hypothetical protein niasHS_008547 [Heterodera schachtii]|uniref:Lon proteolytic domain-containing protein n=1 Tax=Heterodera schachtii TaxID=97005 RepID=A0ABD2JF28_HETSC
MKFHSLKANSTHFHSSPSAWQPSKQGNCAPNILATRLIVVSHITGGFTTGMSVAAAAFAAFFSLALNRCVRMDIALFGCVFATGEVLEVSRIVEKNVGMTDFRLRKVIVPSDNRDRLYAHEREHQWTSEI